MGSGLPRKERVGYPDEAGDAPVQVAKLGEECGQTGLGRGVPGRL